MSAPYCVSPPTLEQQGDKLIAHNGAWRCDSGPIDGYVFAFLRDGGLYAGQTPPPFLDVNKMQPLLDENGQGILPVDYGRSFQVEVFARTYSRYVHQDGTVAYDGYEYGRFINGDPAKPALSNVVVPQAVESAPEPSKPTVLQYIAIAREASDNAVATMEQNGVSLLDRRKSRAGMAARILHATDGEKARAFEALKGVFGWQ
jgi:hypothetical protein